MLLGLYLSSSPALSFQTPVLPRSRSAPQKHSGQRGTSQSIMWYIGSHPEPGTTGALRGCILQASTAPGPHPCGQLRVRPAEAASSGLCRSPAVIQTQASYSETPGGEWRLRPTARTRTCGQPLGDRLCRSSRDAHTQEPTSGCSLSGMEEFVQAGSKVCLSIWSFHSSFLPEVCVLKYSDFN